MVEKSQPTPFDDKPIPGLRFFDGDIVAGKSGVTTGQPGRNTPKLCFPPVSSATSGQPVTQRYRALCTSPGKSDLPFKDTRDGAFERAR